MGKEIEKKYLIYENQTDYSTNNLSEICDSVNALEKKVLKEGTRIQQGYLPIEKGIELAKRIRLNIEFEPAEARLRNKGEKLYFTIKGYGGTIREELETEIDEKIFQEYWPSTKGKRIEKVRLKAPYNGLTAEIDVYLDRKLIVAEVETKTEKEAEQLKNLGLDVTQDSTYKNKNLAK